VAACSNDPGGSTDRDPRNGAQPAPKNAAQPAPQEQQAPAPNAAIPREPGPLAERLVDTHAGLAAAIGRWRSEGRLDSYPPPPDVTRWALHQQRIHLLLTARPALSRRVLRRLPARPAAHLRATIRARRGLRKITPLTPGRYRTGPPEPPRELLRHYRKAQRRFGVPWPVLAAVNFVESGFNRLRNSSAAGAQGPMQFIPSTWQAYGMGGDVHDPHDAIMGAANYLSASGAPENLTGALYAYNPSDLYVRAVLAYTNRIRRDRNAFLSYYSWQVFVRTPDGRTRRLTGPRPL
jgi:soluble lytic murein transglycosylase-like protein